MKAVQFNRYGGPEVLQVVETAKPVAGPGEVVVRTISAALNPGEAAIRSGAMNEISPAHFPEGQGSDLAGLIESRGPDVTHLAEGDEVIGFSDARNAQAEFVLLPADRVVPKPPNLDWAVASTLYVAGTTGVAMVETTQPQPGETVVVAAAAGGVGVFATQLSLAAGARVLAVCGPDNHNALRAWGAEPIAYGDALGTRIRELAPNGVSAMLDAHGDGYIDLALDLGVPTKRIETTIDFTTAQERGTPACGMAAVKDPASAVSRLAQQASSGALEVPIRAHYPLDQVQAAYRDVENGHGLGKVVLDVTAP